MKKTILLTSLMAAVAMAAGTTGSVEFFNENSTDFTSTKAFQLDKLGVKTEVKVKGTGFSFGGETKLKEVKVPFTAKLHKNLVDNSELFAKYELPEVEHFTPSVEAKLNTNTDNKKMKINIKADINYKLKGLKLGFTSNTTTPLNTESKAYEKVVSAHKIYAEGEFAPIKDIKAELEVSNDYHQSAKDSIRDIVAKVEASYKELKDVEINGAFNFKGTLNPTEADKFKYKSIMREDDAEAKFTAGNGLDYVHSYEVEGKYMGVKDTTLGARLFVQHLHSQNTDQDHAVSYGAKLNAEYKGVKDLTVKGGAIVAGYSIVTKHIHVPHIALNLGAKYDYKVTDKFTVSPELNVKSLFDNFAKTNQNKSGVIVDKTIDLTLEPKISAEYKANESLTVSGNITVPVKFGLNGNDFGYKSVEAKSSLNIKYVW